MYKLIRPLIFRFDAEKSHKMTIKALKKLPILSSFKADDILETSLWDRKFPNPVGLAAGFDKNAEVIAPMLKMGFGFVEVGTVTPKFQEGNPTPRIFRCVEHNAVINRMGFPSDGIGIFKQNLEKFLEKKPRTAGIIGLNIGMNKEQKQPAKDYRMLVRMLGPMADYLTVNISSPNTAGLRNLQEKSAFIDLMGEIMEERKKSCGDFPPPLLVKLAPDLNEKQQQELAEAALESKIDGLILTNTTLDRPNYLPNDFAGEKGGLSGRPLTEKSTQIISNFYELTNGQIPIIGVGGIFNGKDAYKKIRAGASLVQLYTAMIYEGPYIARKICAELTQLLKNDGFSSVSDAVGVDIKTNTGQNKKKAIA